MKRSEILEDWDEIKGHLIDDLSRFKEDDNFKNTCQETELLRRLHLVFGNKKEMFIELLKKSVKPNIT